MTVQMQLLLTISLNDRTFLSITAPQSNDIMLNMVTPKWVELIACPDSSGRQMPIKQMTLCGPISHTSVKVINFTSLNFIFYFYYFVNNSKY